MSRSEHGNARDRNDPHDRARKETIKTLIVTERRHLDTEMPPVSSDAIPIDVIDRGPFVHYPASIDDLRGVMARLPEGSLNGLARIELVLTGLDPDADADGLDPFVGRLRNQIAPDVYAPATLGEYYPSDAKIRLYAYVFDRAVSGREAAELYARILMLSTLVHEIGHHQDFMARETRGRWRADAEDLEPNAEARQNEWARSCVVPYVEETYAAEVAQVQHWLARVIGTPLPLELLAGTQGYLLGARDAFEYLLDATREGDPTVEAKLHIAFRLHYDFHFELALAVIDHALASAPEHVEALGDRAHLLEHLERFVEADAIARVLLERDPANLASLWSLRDSASRAGNWPEVIGFASRLLDLGVRDQRDRGRASLSHRARAYIELGDWTAAERDIGELRSIASSSREELGVRFLSCLWNLRRGRDAAAVELAMADPAAVAEISESLRDVGHANFADRLDALPRPTAG